MKHRTNFLDLLYKKQAG